MTARSASNPEVNDLYNTALSSAHDNKRCDSNQCCVQNPTQDKEQFNLEHSRADSGAIHTSEALRTLSIFVLPITALSVSFNYMIKHKLTD